MPDGPELMPHQVKAIEGARRVWSSGKRSALVICPTGCHDPDQPVLMFDGTTKRAEDVEVGDLLMGPDSSPRRVLALHRGEDEMYRIVPTKGDPWVVNAGHILSLVRTSEKSGDRRGGEVVDVPLHEWMAWPRWRKHVHKLFRVGVNFRSPRDTPANPYWIGVLLGDGSVARNVNVTTGDPEILREVELASAFYGASTRSDAGRGCATVHYRAEVRGRANPVLDAVREAGIFGSRSGDKRIPREYMVARFNDRAHLLAGLMDTDGHLHRGGYDYISKSRGLAEDVAFVARSLGLAAYVAPSIKSCQTGAVGLYWRVSISGDCSILPCRVARKKSPPRAQKKSVLRTGFRVEPAGRGRYCGWEVDGDRRYLLGDFTVTHNSGKTMIAGFEIRDTIERGKSCLFLAHRKELFEQAMSTLDWLGVPSFLEKAESRAPRRMLMPRAVVASVPTLRGDRLEQWDRDEFDLVVVDECFPAGTLVDGRPIESLREGDLVRSFSHHRMAIELRKVVRTFKSRPTGLVRVHLSDGTKLVCTPGHPFYVRLKNSLRGWHYAPAEAIEGRWVALFDDQGGSGGEGGLESEDHPGTMRGVQQTGDGPGQDHAVDMATIREGLLLGRVPGRVPAEDPFGDDGQDQPEVRLRSDEVQQPDAPARGTGSGPGDAAGDELEAAGAGRQRAGTDRAPGSPSGSSRVADRGGHPDKDTEGSGLPDELQDRHRRSRVDDGDRGRRKLARELRWEAEGRQEGRLPRFARVDRVEVLQRGSDGRFGGLCPDGHVYNVEVEGNHNYLAGGVLVHNCHHSTADTWSSIVRYFRSPRVLGLTATPDRADGSNVGAIFDEVAYEYPLWQAIEDGVLARPVTVWKRTGVDLSAIRTTGGDLNDGDLADAIGPAIEELANAAYEECHDRRTLVFTPDVGSAQAFAHALCQLGMPARAVWGDCPDRDEIIAEYKDGQIQAIVNCALLTEGFDCLDEETEILTEKGWVSRGGVEVGDLVYAFNRDTEMIDLVPVTRKVERPVAPGERMVTIRGQHANIRVTEGHEFHIKYRDPGLGGRPSNGFITRSAADLVARRSPYILPISGELSGGFPGLPVSDDVIRFVAWFMTDGGFERLSLTINQSKEAKNEIRELLVRLGFDFRERIRVSKTAYSDAKTHEFRIPKGTDRGSKARNGWFPYAHLLDKKVAPALHQMDSRQFGVFWSELLKGDGSVQDGKSGWLWCCEKSQADAYTRMAVLRGYAASYAEETTKNGTKVYRVSVRPARWLSSAPSDPRAARVRFEDPVPGEVVWCVTNQNSTLIARRHGKIAIIGNCPATDAIVLARPTKSRGLLAQMVGRGLRKKPSGSQSCVLIDFEWLTGRHKLVKPFELMRPSAIDPEVMREAEKKAKQGGADLLDALKEAEDLVHRRREVRVRAQRRTYSHHTRVVFDPVGVMDYLGIGKVAERDNRRATPKQVGALSRLFKVENAETLGFRQATRMLDVLFSRMEAGYATPTQVGYLISNGVDPEVARSMNKAEASARLSEIFGRN